ncbi:MAG TPA: glycerophosphodiester phosphodiesterase family protein [Bryobacteraceae bacterium]|nr:glycerophosphodiester phosphodiesterase family protein [Bryobacteraceae bacterium]
MLHQQKGFKIIGHRGYGPTPAALKTPENLATLLPENSLAAFKYALDHGADGIECDVFLSGDGVPMVIHDDDIDQHAAPAAAAPLAGQLVSRMTAAAVSAIDIGGGHTVPRLEDLFALVFGYTDRRVIINLDIKDTTCVSAVCALMQKHAAALAAHDVIVSSFNWDILRDFRARDAHIMLVPAIKSKILFGAENIGPGYVPLVENYQSAARDILELVLTKPFLGAGDRGFLLRGDLLVLCRVGHHHFEQGPDGIHLLRRQTVDHGMDVFAVLLLIHGHLSGPPTPV